MFTVKNTNNRRKLTEKQLLINYYRKFTKTISIILEHNIIRLKLP
jgi:hypothetical protein